ncbi:MAG: hypothetical protein J6K16_06455 [Alphaproteobacteria bacterium]|nr:hypothetical protein [Alphaproteobacteria bacterium]
MFVNVFIAVLFTVFMVLMIACASSSFLFKDNKETFLGESCLDEAIKAEEVPMIRKWFADIVADRALSDEDQSKIRKSLDKLRPGKTYGTVACWFILLLKHYPSTNWSIISFRAYNSQISLMAIKNQARLSDEVKNNTGICLKMCDCFLYNMRRYDLLTESYC